MRLEELTLRELLDRVGEKSPIPGGGAVTAAVGALASSLGSMVVAYSLGRRDLAAHQQELERDSGILSRARGLLVELAAEDAAAYAALNDVLRLPRHDPRRASELPGAALAATQAPLAVIAACADLLRHLEELAGRTNRRLRSDLAIAAVLAEAAARASRWNVAVNMQLLGEPAGPGQLAVADEMLEHAAARLRGVESACR